MSDPHDELIRKLRQMAPIRTTIAELEATLRRVRDNMQARMVWDFDYDKGQYPLTTDTVMTLLMERNEARDLIAKLEAALVDTWDALDASYEAVCAAGVCSAFDELMDTHGDTIEKARASRDAELEEANKEDSDDES